MVKIKRNGYHDSYFRQQIETMARLIRDHEGAEVVIFGETWRLDSWYAATRETDSGRECLLIGPLVAKWMRAGNEGSVQQLRDQLFALNAYPTEPTIKLRSFLTSDGVKGLSLASQKWAKQYISTVQEKAKWKEREAELKAREESEKQSEKQKIEVSQVTEFLSSTANSHTRDGTWKSTGEVIDDYFSKINNGKRSRGQRRSRTPLGGPRKYTSTAGE